MIPKTIRDVAREASVSIATVSYVLNGSRPVADETRRRVLTAVQTLGYRANITARNLQASETRLFGYTWRPSPPDSFNPILDGFLHAVSEAAARRDYRLLTFPTATVDDELATYHEMIRIGQVDGFVLSNTNLDDQRVAYLLASGFPFVAFGRANPDWDFPWVDVDGARGLELATQHLIGRGHRRIACLAWPAESLTGEYRLQGYLRGMAAAGLEVQPAWVARGANLYGDAYHLTRELLSLPPGVLPSAVVAMSDLMAMGAVNAAWDGGREVGRNFAVVGFDDAPTARFFRPSLSSLAQPLAEVGERLAAMLADKVRSGSVAEPGVLLEPRLVIRDSSAEPYVERLR